MDTEHICPSCRKPLPAGAPQGLCPECLMKAGFGSGVAPEPGQPSRAPAFVPPSAAEMARLFPQFEIMELLGQGGMGAVYKARQPALDRLVALKILPPETGADTGFADRFTREARALAKLSHPNIVAVHEFGQAGGLHYFVMEYVEGLNLRQLEQAGRLSPREALKIIPQICDALQFAHDEGIVHRDIKPENVMLDKKGRVKITDFGLAKILGREPTAVRLTGAKDVMGTPHYMAPEQIEHPQEVDHRADIYSLGVVFYEMLTGELPLGRFAPPSRKVQVDVRLDEVVLHALEKEPERRYQQASQVKTDVETIGRTPPSADVGPKKMAELRRHLLVKAGCLAFAALCLLIATISFAASDQALPAVLSLVATVFFGIAAYRHFSGAQRGSVESAGSSERRSDSTRSQSKGQEDLAAIERARRLVRWPAIGLITTSLLGPFMLGFLVVIGRMEAGAWMFVPLVLQIALIVVAVLGSYKLLHLESRRMALAGGIAGCVMSFLNFLCLPFAVWSLAVASRRDVRDLFGKVAGIGAPGSPGGQRPAKAWKLPFEPVWYLGIIAGLALIAGLIAWGMWERRFAVSPDAVVHIEEKLARELKARVVAADFGVASVSVNIDRARRNRAECLIGGLVKYWGAGPQKPGTQRLYSDVSGGGVFRHEGGGLWSFVGNGALEKLRFHVDASAEMASNLRSPGATPEVFKYSEPEGADAAANPNAVLASRFGPVGQVTLNDIDDLHGGEALDLDSGQLLDLPKDIEKRPKLERLQWLNDQSADLLLDRVDGKWGLLTTTTNELRLAPLDNESWDAVTKEALSKALAAAPTGLEIKQRGPWQVYVLATNKQPPLTFAFMTASGATGLLQITRLTETPNFARLRYKLVTPTTAPPSTLTTVQPTGPKPFAQARPGEFKVSLTNGLEFEVLAVASSPRSSSVWWRPDGTLLPEAPGDRLGAFSTLCPDRKASTEFALLTRRAGEFVPETELLLGFEPRPHYVTCTDLYQGSQTKGRVTLIGFRDVVPGSLICKIGLADGAWERVATWDQAGVLLKNESGSTLQLIRSGADGQTCLKLNHNLDPRKFALRLAARLKNGENKTARLCRVEYAGLQNVHTCSLIQNLEDSEVVAYELYRLPLRWARVPGIATQPAMPPLEERQAAATLGPEKEVVLTEFNNRDGQEALDLDSGKVHKQPKDMDQWSEAGFIEWVTQNGIDVLVDQGPGNRWGLMTILPAELRLARVWNEKWAGIGLEELLAALTNSPLPLEVVDKGDFRIVVPPKEAPAPVTLAFKTRAGGLGLLQIAGLTDKPRGVRIRYKLVQTPSETARLEDLSEADRARAVAIFNDIEDFGDEFTAAFTSKNLPAAETGTRRLFNLLSNFNAVVKGTGYEFSPGLFEDIGKLHQALKEGDWDKVEQAARYNHAYGSEFKRAADRMVALARELQARAGKVFGPVVERVLAGAGDANKRFIDLDKGRLFAAAQYFGPKAEPSPEETQKWLQETGIDAVADTRSLYGGLVGFNMVASPVPSEEWDRLPPSKLDYYLAMSTPGTPVVMSGKGALPATYAVKTREGGCGLLQILNLTTNDPPEVSIRYRLVQPSD